MSGNRADTAEQREPRTVEHAVVWADVERERAGRRRIDTGVLAVDHDVGRHGFGAAVGRDPHVVDAVSAARRDVRWRSRLPPAREVDRRSPWLVERRVGHALGADPEPVIRGELLLAGACSSRTPRHRTRPCRPSGDSRGRARPGCRRSALKMRAPMMTPFTGNQRSGSTSADSCPIGAPSRLVLRGLARVEAGHGTDLRLHARPADGYGRDTGGGGIGPSVVHAPRVPARMTRTACLLMFSRTREVRSAWDGKSLAVDGTIHPV